MWSKVDIKEYEKKDHLKSVANFFVPNRLELTLYFFFSLIVIITLNLETYWDLINGEGTTLSAKAIIDDQIANYDAYLHSNFFGQATGFVVWAIIGSFAYMMVWFIQHFLKKLKLDVEESGYQSNKAKRGGYWESRIAQLFILFASTVSLMAVLTSLTYFVPLAGSLGSAIIQNPGEVSSYIYLLLGVLLGVLAQYVLVRFWRLFKYSFNDFFGGVKDE